MSFKNPDRLKKKKNKTPKVSQGKNNSKKVVKKPKNFR